MVKFLRRSSDRYSKLGKGRKKKQKWRRPTGRDNKIRERRRGYSARVNIGYQKNKKDMYKIKGKIPITINNVKDLEKVGKENIGIIAHVGKKKREEIVKKAKEKKILLYNVWTKKKDTLQKVNKK